MKQPKLKKNKKVVFASVATIALSAVMTLSALSCDMKNNSLAETPTAQHQTQTQQSTPNLKPNYTFSDTSQYRSLEQLRKVKLPTYTQRFKGKEHKFVAEEDLLQISRELSVAIEDYFKSHGASDWSNPDEERFWPEDIEYIVVAIAFAESSYCADYINDIQCGGLTGLHKESLLKTLNGWANNADIWGKDIPYINCNPDEVDIFNPVTCMEYTYYNIGYILANRLKKNKSFIDSNGQKHSIWKHTEYSDKVQTDLVIANNLWGIDNIETAGLGTNKQGYTVDYFCNSEYVNKVLDKTNELINTYENTLSR